MKPFEIRAAGPLLHNRDNLINALQFTRTVSTASLRLSDDRAVTIPSHAAQAIIQSMIDAVEADLLALGVDLSDG